MRDFWCVLYLNAVVFLKFLQIIVEVKFFISFLLFIKWLSYAIYSFFFLFVCWFFLFHIFLSFSISFPSEFFLFVFPARLAYLAHLAERDITVAGTYIYIIRPSAHWLSPIQIVFNSVGYIIIYIYIMKLFKRNCPSFERSTWPWNCIYFYLLSYKFIRKCRDITFVRHVNFLSIWNWFHEEFCIFSSFLIFIRMETLNEYWNRIRQQHLFYLV